MIAVIAAAILSQPAPVPMVHGVAECSSWPLAHGEVTADGIRVVSVHWRAPRVTARLRNIHTGRRTRLEAFRIGRRVPGWSVWSISSPARVFALFQAAEGLCVAYTAAEIPTLPAGVRDWMTARVGPGILAGDKP